MDRVIQLAINEESLEKIFNRPISEIDHREILQFVINSFSLFLEQKIGLDSQDVLIGYTENFSPNTN